MKHLLIVIAVLLSFSGTSQLKKWFSSSDVTPIVNYSNKLQTFNGFDTLTIHSLGIGIGLTKVNIQADGFPVILTWEYFALPFIKVDFNFANQKGKRQLFSPRDEASPIVLSVGITRGKGFALFYIPFGINATAALATDFQDMFINYGLAYDVNGISIGISGLINLIKNNNSFYKTTPGLEFRYIWNWD